MHSIGNTYEQTYELCGPDIYSLAEILQFIKTELGLKRAIIPLPVALGRVQAWIADYLIPGKPFSLDNLRSLSLANVCSEDGLSKLGIEPRSMQTIARAYIKRQPNRLSR